MHDWNEFEKGLWGLKNTLISELGSQKLQIPFMRLSNIPQMWIKIFFIPHKPFFQTHFSSAFKWNTFRKPWVNMTTHLILDRFTFFDVGRNVCTIRRFESFCCFFHTFGIWQIFWWVLAGDFRLRYDIFCKAACFVLNIVIAAFLITANGYFILGSFLSHKRPHGVPQEYFIPPKVLQILPRG